MQTEFRNALADALGGVVAKERETWRKEREIAQAEARQTIAELGQKAAKFELTLHQLQIADHDRVNERIASVKDGAPGKDGEPGKDAAPGKDGLSVTIADVEPLIAAEVEKAVAAIPIPKNGLDGEPGKDGKDADPDALALLVSTELGKAVAALPPAQPGKDADPELVARLVAAEVDKAIADLPKPKDGKDGEPGSAADVSVVPDDVAELVSKAVTLLAEAQLAANKSAPIVLHISSPERQQKPLTKTITTRKDKAGNLVADVVEH